MDDVLSRTVLEPPRQSSHDRDRDGYRTSLVAELRLLVRTIAGDPGKRLNTLRMTYKLPGKDAAEELAFDRILQEIATAEDSPHKLEMIGFLQAVRDALVGMTAPATGLTVAYTTLVTGESRDGNTESAHGLASRAYNMMTRRARWHSVFAYILLFATVGLTLLAAYDATRAALGKSLLQNMDLLRVQQTAILAEKLKLETSLDKPGDEKEFTANGVKLLPAQWVPLCDRPLHRKFVAVKNGFEMTPDAQGQPLSLAASPAERDLCGRDSVLAKNIAIVHREMEKFLKASFPVGVFGSFFSTSQLDDHECPNGTTPKGSGNGSADASAAHAGKCDVEFTIAPLLQVATNYSLPLLFGFIGSLLYVMLDYFTKIRANTLHPKDLPLMALRLILGLVVAASVSLLVSSYAGPALPSVASGGAAAGSLVASLTLSASGLAFLAGFGAEAVFNLLQGVIERVFVVQK